MEQLTLIKVGGKIVEEETSLQQLLADFASLPGHKVLVHGGGPEISDMLKRVGKESKFIGGLRYTDEETAEIVQMVLAGKINKNLVGMLTRHGGKALGFCGIDGNMFVCKKAKGEHDLGFVGEITDVNAQPVLDALDNGYIPVVASVSSDAEGNIYNGQRWTDPAGGAGARPLLCAGDRGAARLRGGCGDP